MIPSLRVIEGPTDFGREFQHRILGEVGLQSIFAAIRRDTLRHAGNVSPVYRDPDAPL